MHVASTTAAFALLLAAATAFEAPNRSLRPPQGLDLLRMLAEKPWLGLGPHNRWDRPPRIDTDIGPKELEVLNDMDDNVDSRINVDDLIRTGSDKRSAVATALNAGRRRRQPTPALGKAVTHSVTPYVGVGVLNDMGTFFDSLRDNLETLASLSPEQRSSFFQGPPTVVQAPSSAATAFEAPNRSLRPPQGLDLLRMLAEKPWLGLGPHNRWDRPPRIDTDIGPKELEVLNDMDDNVDSRINVDDLIRTGSDKRSAVATALNAGRRRRQPTPALGKAVTHSVTPYVGVGVLNDMGTFFDSLRDNLETLASLSPEQRSSFFQGPPTVVQAPSSGGGGGGSGIRKLHALRPLRPTGNIRAYNRRSFVEAEDYPGANHHDPGLLWTGLGR